MSSEKPIVAIVMGSNSDWQVLTHAAEQLRMLTIPYETEIVSAHRTPDKLFDYATNAESRGFRSDYCGCRRCSTSAWDVSFENKFTCVRCAYTATYFKWIRFVTLDCTNASWSACRGRCQLVNRGQSMQRYWRLPVLPISTQKLKRVYIAIDNSKHNR